MSTTRVILLATLLALTTTATTQAQSQSRFQCWGSYTNIFQAPQSGDPSGIEVFILSRSEVFVVVGEGHIIGTKARNISINGNKISFDYWQNKFSAVCVDNGLRYTGFDERTGRPSNNLLLAPGSFVTRKRVEVKWE
jgi:hypothetical protein